MIDDVGGFPGDLFIGLGGDGEGGFNAFLARTAHAHGALLLVDAAHGAHFPFSDALPKELGGIADLFAHSQHKTMDALTQAASLHLGECRIGEEQVRRALALVETTSPSYLLMASLDWSVFMARRRNWTAQVARCKALETRIEAIEGLKLFHDPVGSGVLERDRTRLVIDVSGRGLSGYEAEAYLEKKKIYIEMADARRLVLITTPSDEPEWYERLLNALAALPIRQNDSETDEEDEPYTETPARRMTIRDATFARTELLALADAAGHTAAETVGVYPPGVALIMPGEVFSERAVRYLLRQEALGGTLFGVRSGSVFVTAER